MGRYDVTIVFATPEGSGARENRDMFVVDMPELTDGQAPVAMKWAGPDGEKVLRWDGYGLLASASFTAMPDRLTPLTVGDPSSWKTRVFTVRPRVSVEDPVPQAGPDLPQVARWGGRVATETMVRNGLARAACVDGVVHVRAREPVYLLSTRYSGPSGSERRHVTVVEDGPEYAAVDLRRVDELDEPWSEGVTSDMRYRVRVEIPQAVRSDVRERALVEVARPVLAVMSAALTSRDEPYFVDYAALRNAVSVVESTLDVGGRIGWDRVEALADALDVASSRLVAEVGRSAVPPETVVTLGRVRPFVDPFEGYVP